MRSLSFRPSISAHIRFLFEGFIRTHKSGSGTSARLFTGEFISVDIGTDSIHSGGQGFTIVFLLPSKESTDYVESVNRAIR